MTSLAAPSRDGDVLRLERVNTTFGTGEARVAALDDVDLTVRAGDRVALVGPSGSGKSTLLHLAAGLDLPTSGLVQCCGESLTELSEEERSQLRLQRVGFVFQFFNLLPGLTALENVQVPALLRGDSRAQASEHARELLGRVGLGDRASHHPSQLSGGQMQRVAIARALVARPSLVLADEPTGNLDRESGHEVLDLLSDVV